MKYEPHNYQQFATDFILEHPISCLMLDMGLGKTVITLTALWQLALDSFDVSRILVIAPKRVAEDTWPQGTEQVGTPLWAGCHLGDGYPGRTGSSPAVSRLFFTSSIGKMSAGW